MKIMILTLQRLHYQSFPLTQIVLHSRFGLLNLINIIIFI